MNYLLFYYLISRTIMIFAFLIVYADQRRRTEEMTIAYTRAILACLIPPVGELLFLQTIIATILIAMIPSRL